MKERWEYYWGNAGFWFISDNDTDRYFMADHKSDAEWLVEQLNGLEACKAETKCSFIEKFTQILIDGKKGSCEN